MNLLPLKQRDDTDFSRVRDWYLNGWGSCYRQTICVSAFETPHLNLVLKRHTHNQQGLYRARPVYPGLLQRVVPEIRQIFQRLASPSLAEEADLRFAFFCERLFPKIAAAREGHVLLVVPSYFDYVRVRNFCKQKKLSMTLACEYTRQAELSRGRSAFYHGEKKVLIVTERFHFFRRYRLRGVHQLIFYSLPTHPYVYEELINCVPQASARSCVVLWSRYGPARLCMPSPACVRALFEFPCSCVAMYVDSYEQLALERIVGSTRAQSMLQATEQVTMFA